MDTAQHIGIPMTPSRAKGRRRKRKLEANPLLTACQHKPALEVFSQKERCERRLTLQKNMWKYCLGYLELGRGG